MMQTVPPRGFMLKGMSDEEVLRQMNDPRGTCQHKAGYEHNPGKGNRSEVYEHSNKLGAGAKKRKHMRGKAKVGVVMHEFKRGTLHSGSGEIVTNPKQAVAIAMSEAGMSKKKRK